MIRIRRLTSAGWTVFEQVLDVVADQRRLDGSPIGLADPALSEPHQLGVQIDESRVFASRFDCAEYLYSILGEGRVENAEQDLMLWGWLAAVYFDQLCPPDGNGIRKIGQRARYLPSTRYTTRYRHLLAGPYRIYQSHADDPSRALAALAGRVDSPGELAEQLSARVEVIATPSIVGAATLLYMNPETGSPRRGAGGAGRGSARRFGRIVRQYDLTWDLAGMTPESIVARLPQEFDRFRT